MFPMTPIAAALALLFCAGALAAPVADGTTPRSLLAQAKGLPADFEEHFFDVPLAVRVERDQEFVGEAMIVLSREDTLTLLAFNDHEGSPVSGEERERWAEYLKQQVPLGACERNCPDQLLAVHYNLEKSIVSLLTENAERDTESRRYHELPHDASVGLIVRNQLNLNGGQGQDTGGRFGIDASSSVGNWSQVLNAQFSRLGGPDDDTLNHAVYSLYTQRELEGQFLRLGYFTPNAEGLTRQLRTFGASPDTAIGVMYGSSDTLMINNPKASIYPIAITANRQGSVEIYRNGLLINTQPVTSGLQNLDTRPLPGGIYEVEVRLIEDGQVTNTTQELVYKPNNWRNHDDRWRYNVFAGQESKLLSNWDEQSSGDMTAGVSLNYLAHPRVVLGVSGRQVKDNMQYGTSIDWTLANSASVYANLYQTEKYGTGVDLNGLYNYGLGTVVLNHTRSWLDTRNTYEYLPDGTRIHQQLVDFPQPSSQQPAFGERQAVSHRRQCAGAWPGPGLD